MELIGLEKCLAKNGYGFEGKVNYNKNKFENEERMFKSIKNQFKKHYNLENDPYIYNEDDKFQTSGCDTNSFNIAYSKFLNRNEYALEYSFSVIYPIDFKK